ncbi:MAG: PfkB family carbohydrate kinase [Clostridia bacterium]
MSKVICIGECLVDMIPTKFENMEYIAKAGGAPANVAACVSSLGGNGCYLGKMSTDNFSDFLLNKMQESGVNTDYVVRDKNYKTAIALVTLDSKGDRQFTFYRQNTADLMLNSKEINIDMFDKGDILHFCSVSLVESPIKNAHIRAINLVKDKGGLVSFDINLRLGLWEDELQCRQTIKSFVPLADILKLTLEELQWLTGFENEKQGMFVLWKMALNAKIILLTKGSDGAIAFIKGEDVGIYCPADDVKVLDTTGAGDCFSGCVLYQIAKNGMISDLDTLANVVNFASIGCGYVIGKKGALESMPNLEYIQNKLSVMSTMITQPIFFERNRVYRIYLGGKQYADLCGDVAEDSLFPEEWIASKVKAINPKYFGKRDGVSKIAGTNIYFDDLLNQYSKELLGTRKYDCLVKYLDSAIRLPVQVHPTKEFSKKHFNSTYGKTEAWLVVNTRENAKIYFGFNRAMTKEEFGKYEERSLEEKDIMSTILAEVSPKVGDIYLINAGLIHAIGEGCTIIEVQEPTDFTIQPENWCGDIRISEWEKYIGLDKSTALDCFDYSLFGKKAINQASITPKIEIKKDGYTKENLITYENTTCFAENRHILTGGEFVMDYAPAVYIVLEGKAQIIGENYLKQVSKGEYFFLPFSAQNKYKIRSDKATIIECLPSKQK